jgi:hypothetical protein
MARALNEMVLADLIAARAETRPDLDVVTFEGGPSGLDEIRTYAGLWVNANRLAAVGYPIGNPAQQTISRQTHQIIWWEGGEKQILH